MPLFQDSTAAAPDADARPARRSARPQADGGGGGLTHLQAYLAEPSPLPHHDLPTTSVDSNSMAATLGQAYAHPTVLPPGWAEYAAGFDKQFAPAPEPEPEPEPEAQRYRSRTTKELSWDKYLELSDRERAAVDFNTLLIQARQKDLNHQEDYEPNDQQEKVYDRTVKRMFGPEGVSETYAPETVALLNDIGFEGSDAKRFDDLDDFLGLSAALTSKDLDKIGKLHPSPVLSGDTSTLGIQSEGPMDLSLGGLAAPPALPHDNAAQTATVLASGTDSLKDSLVRGEQILENWRRIGTGSLAESVGYYGGLVPERFAAPQIRLAGDDEIDFPLAYEAVANAANEPSIFGGIKNFLKGDRLKRFLQYADTRSAYSMEHQMGLGTNSGVQYRSPEEFRQIIGLDEGGGTSASDTQ